MYKLTYVEDFPLFARYQEINTVKDIKPGTILSWHNLPSRLQNKILREGQVKYMFPLCFAESYLRGTLFINRREVIYHIDLLRMNKAILSRRVRRINKQLTSENLDKSMFMLLKRFTQQVFNQLRTNKVERFIRFE